MFAASFEYSTLSSRLVIFKRLQKDLENQLIRASSLPETQTVMLTACITLERSFLCLHVQVGVSYHFFETAETAIKDICCFIITCYTEA